MAQQLSPEQAKANAEAFLQQKTGLRSTSELQLSFSVSDTTQLDAVTTLRAISGSSDALLYAFSREAGGFVIASGDEPYTHTFHVVADPTANGQVTSIQEMTVSWQGHTLCVESALPLKSYHIYKVNGEAVATGPISGTSARIEGSAWQTGVYIVAIKTEDGKTEVYKIQL